MMEKHSELPEAIRAQRQRWLHDRWIQLNTLEKEWSERAYKFLFLTNAGGAIAVLSFLGSYQKAMALFAAKGALAFFLVGVVMVGCGTAQAFHHISGSLRTLNSDTRQLYKDEISYADLLSRDDQRHKQKVFSLLLPYTSFGSFIAGCGCGAYALFSSI